ncbi:MAG: beta-lactamase family protein [Bacteroidetes bacterium]|nr:beta-lactamase family protein [Bacteroidota bacterium]
MAILKSVRGTGSYTERSLLVVMSLILSMLFVSCKDENSSEAMHKNYSDEIKKVLDVALDSIRRADPQFPGGLALQVIYPGGQVFQQTGFTNAVTTGTHFRAASNTKTLTAAAILLLHQRGKLNINHKITDTIPGTNITYVPGDQNYAIPFKNEITILQLMQHRAGVFDVANDPIPDTVSAPVPYKNDWYLEYMKATNPNYTFTFDELAGVVATTGLYYFRPGTDFHYSNTGYSILGKIIERVSGKSYGQFITDEIIKPMGMTSSSMPDQGSDQQLPAPFAPGFVHIPGSIQNVSMSNVSGNVAEGNLVTTPADLSLFIRKLLRGEGVLSSNLVYSTMLNCLPTAPGSLSLYGCGVNSINMLGYGHTGAHEGYLSQMIHDPVTDVTLVIYTNAWDLREGIASIRVTMGHMQEALYKAKRIVLAR